MFQPLSSFCQLFLIALSFLGMLFFIWKARHRLWEEFRVLPRVYVLGLVLLAAVSIIFSAYFIFPKHIIEDEATYQVAAKSILTAGHLGGLPKSGGWAFLISLGYLFEGINNYVSIQISQLLGAGSIPGIFFLAMWAGLSLRAAFIAASLFTFVPARLFWANTGESHTASIFFVIWAAAFSFLLYRNRDKDVFWLVVSVWIFSVLVRSETIVLFLFFLVCVRVFLPKHIYKNLPFSNALFWAAVILTPQMVLGIKHVLGNQWVATGSNVSVYNFLHNAGSYGVDFIIGKVHPIFLSFAAMFGWAVICRRDKRIAALLAGWLFLLSLTYFSMWFQNYGENPGLFLKTRLFVFFYPPLVLCAASGLVWVADKYAFRYGKVVAAVLCGVIITWFFLYYDQYPLGSDKYVLEMRLVDEIGQMVTPQDMVVTCFPQTFTGALVSSMATTDILWFLQEPVWRAEAFQKARHVYLVDDIVSQRRCQESVSFIKDKGKAVLVKEWMQKNTRYNMYILSSF